MEQEINFLGKNNISIQRFIKIFNDSDKKLFNLLWRFSFEKLN